MRRWASSRIYSKLHHAEAQRHRGKRAVFGLHTFLRAFAPLREKFGIIFFLVFLLGVTLSVHPFDDRFQARGDAAIAERYVLWAQNKINQGLWSEALAGLERASDFADVSSDISYLLALARSRQHKSRSSVVEALGRALVTDRWNLYRSEDARLLKAEYLIALRSFSDALFELSMVSRGLRQAELTLKALSAFNHREFRRFMAETLDFYPRDTGPARIFFQFLKNEKAMGRTPDREDFQMIDILTRRLPDLIQRDAELAWMAAPFLHDRADARRLVLAYRAQHEPAPASLPIALELGAIDEITALEELFNHASRTLDLALLERVWGLLGADARALFRRNLSVYSGVITEDVNRDGIPETFAQYHEGMLILSSYDFTQNGIPDIVVFFEAGIARRATVYFPPDRAGIAILPLSGNLITGTRRSAEVIWEVYSAVKEVKLDGARFIPRPFDFFYAPFVFVELWGSGLFFPQRNPLTAPLTRRVLVSHALRVERPSLEFDGGIEVIELNAGIPIRAREFVGELMVSETEFLRGRPRIQRVDLDFNGHMETVRHFRWNERPMDLEYLWDLERYIEYTIIDRNQR